MIRRALQRPLGDVVEVCGWARQVRKQRHVGFLRVNDGSSQHGVQAVFSADDDGGDALELLRRAEVTVGASVRVTGRLRAPPSGRGAPELAATAVEVLGACDAKRYPLQPKRHSLEFLRSIGHLRARSNTFGAVARVRNALEQALHAELQAQDFLQVHAPVVTGNDCEGAGETFSLKDDEFFGGPAFLTVSGQLHAEAFASALSRVYSFGPTFRAEHSNTPRHLAEFWMLEPEMAFAGLPEAMDLAEACVAAAADAVLTRCGDEVEFFGAEAAQRLQLAQRGGFARMTYTEAVRELQRAHPAAKFAQAPEWGPGLATEHERFLADEVVGGPVFVTDYPAGCKPFYMLQNDDDPATVACMDLLVPGGVGELVGGSAREERLDRLGDEGGPALEWYRDLRRFGSVPHAGWGLGFERLVLYATGLTNVRDAVPVPRAQGQCAM